MGHRKIGKRRELSGEGRLVRSEEKVSLYVSVLCKPILHRGRHMCTKRPKTVWNKLREFRVRIATFHITSFGLKRRRSRSHTITTYRGTAGISFHTRHHFRDPTEAHIYCLGRQSRGICRMRSSPVASKDGGSPKFPISRRAFHREGIRGKL